MIPTTLNRIGKPGPSDCPQMAETPLIKVNTVTPSGDSMGTTSEAGPIVTGEGHIVASNSLQPEAVGLATEQRNRSDLDLEPSCC